MTERREILNDAEVNFLLAAAGNDDVATTPATPGGDERAVTMRGDLEQINLADIFQTLAMSKMEGVLRVRNPLEERQVYCHNGTVRILVPSRVAVRRLGQRLVQAGLIQVEQLRTALMEQRKEPMPLGELLVRQGLVTVEQIDAVAGMQIAEDLFALFTWRHGTFEFFKGPLTNDKQRQQFEMCPEFEVNSLLLEVARRSDEWQSILEAIGSLDEVPKRIADPADESTLKEEHRLLLAGANGEATYRDLAEQTTQGLFEVARAARDLVAGGLLANLDAMEMVTLATARAANADPKRALLFVQTLRDRPEERSTEVVFGMATALEKAGERRLAGTTLLEAAQLQSDSKSALELARRARALAPYDAGTLSFLRTTLMAHVPIESAELEKVTLDLLDALAEADLTSTALEIIEDARTTGSLGPQLLTREARIRQKARDVEGAASTLLALANLYEAAKDRPRAIETYEALLRLDRSRKDIQKHLASLKRTKLGRLVRTMAITFAVIMLGGMGFVFWQQRSFESAVQLANAEIVELLAQGNRAGACERWDHWAEVIGICEPLEDLQSRIAFAESAERGRLQKLARGRLNEQLTRAAETLGKGELKAALHCYEELWREPALRTEVSEVVATRFDALLDSIAQAQKGMSHRLPVEPTSLFDRRDLTNNLADLQSVCSPSLLRVFMELDELAAAKALPPFLSEAHGARVAIVLSESREVFAKAQRLASAYTEALQRNDDQRRLDPMFKAAVARESAHDFAGALELFRELERQPAGDAELRAHFRDHVARNATICRLVDALRDATAGGDHAAALQQLKALRMAFPDIPFERLVRMPLRIESLPNGAKVLCNGKEVGRTPLVLAITPAEEHRIEVTLDGFRAAHTTISGSEADTWTGHLLLDADVVRKHGNQVEVAPCTDAEGRLFLVDRAVAVTAMDQQDGSTLWKFESNDLSGLLTPPLVHGAHVLVASLDGDLRALQRASGKLAWSLPDLPTEGTPVLIDPYLVLATTTRRLCVVDLAEHRMASVGLPERVHGALLAHGSTVVAVGERGLITAHSVPSLRVVWQRQLEYLTGPAATIVNNHLAVVDEEGHVHGLDLATGAARWTRNLATETLGPPVAAAGSLLITSATRLFRLDAATGQERQAVDKGDQDWAGPPVVIGERLVVPLRDGPLQVLDLQTGRPLYRIEAAKRCRLHAVGNSLFVAMPDHRLLVFHKLR